MALKLRVNYVVPKASKTNLRMVSRGQSVQEVISLIEQMDGADISELSLDGSRVAPEDLFDDFSESKDRLFVFWRSDPWRQIEIKREGS
jgi:hypothetical protein